MKRHHRGLRITRRRFLQLATGGLAWWLAGSPTAHQANYRVGVGQSPDPYVATRQAVDACGEWPGGAIAGRTVVIKPNLVVPMPASTGATTDPQVVRALVDLALEAGARQALLVESGPQGANFAPCGYDFFSDYDPAGRVALVDLNEEPVVLVAVPGGGMAYTELYMPELLLADDVVFISAAKLKCHFHTHVTLAMKNLMGLPPVDRYRIPPDEWRFEMHHRGISQVIVDLNLVRPIDFAVVDGVVGMEGDGPVRGTLVELGLVVAGQNAVAVDRVCLEVMAFPQDTVKHLTYATGRGLGPGDASGVEILGTSFTLRPFAWPTRLPPMPEYRGADPDVFTPKVGQQTTITCEVDSRCWMRVEIVRTSETSPEVTLIRILQDWASQPAGSHPVIWDGRDDAGDVVSPGRYTVRVQAKYSDDGTEAYATGWVWVTEYAVYLPALFKPAK